MTRILIVDDSPTAHQAIHQMLDDQADIQVVADVYSGSDAIREAQQKKPDIILMDLFMPQMNGLEVTEEIMALQPTPIVIMSGSLNEQEASATFQAMRLGALAVIQKPVGPLHPDYEAQSQAFLRKIRTLSTVKVIHHRKTLQAKPDLAPDSKSPQEDLPVARPKLVAIAISTGGPGIIADILKQLPAEFPVPIVIVQHITNEFVPSLVNWLNGITPLRVCVAEQGGIPQAGHVYFAPGNAHLLINGVHRFELDYSTPATHTPSADIFLESVSKSYRQKAVGFVLTGMGSDGAAGLRKMFDAGAYTLSQDEATSIVYGMPREALALGGVRRVVSAPEIPQLLQDLANLG